MGVFDPALLPRGPGLAKSSHGAHSPPQAAVGGLGTIVGATFLGLGIACLEMPTFEDLERDEARHADHEIGGSFD